MMWKKHSTYTLFAAALLLVLPALAVTFVPPDAGMMALLLLLMAINPLTLIQIGVQAGKNSLPSGFIRCLRSCSLPPAGTSC